MDPTMSSSVCFRTKETPLQLDEFRQQLIRQEETIIFALIERSQFPVSPEIYVVGSKEVVGEDSPVPPTMSFLDYMLCETEKLHALVRRYTSPDECAFFPDSLPQPILSALHYPRVLHPNGININPRVKNLYLERILPKLCIAGSQNSSYGSTSSTDIAVLQALSKRIHFGKYIAEAKFQAETERYTALIKANDAEGIMATLTNAAVEERVLQRVEMKANTFGQDITDQGPKADDSRKVEPSVIRELYRDFVIPLTKEVQVMYLLQRLNHDSIAIPTSVLNTAHPAYTAAVKVFGDEAKDNITAVGGPSEVFQAVMSHKVCYGIVLMAEGSQNGLLELFCKSQVFISDEITLKQEVDDETKSSLFMDASVPTATSELRFVIISKVQGVATGNDKTAVCFGIADHAGGLLECLNVFHTHSINMCVIHSLRLHGKPVIYVEFQGHSADAQVQAALSDLKAKATSVTFLGSWANKVR